MSGKKKSIKKVVKKEIKGIIFLLFHLFLPFYMFLESLGVTRSNLHESVCPWSFRG